MRMNKLLNTIFVASTLCSGVVSAGGAGVESSQALGHINGTNHFCPDEFGLDD